MSNIPGIEKLNGLLTSEQMQKISSAADRHASASNMNFSILSASQQEIAIETTQSETKSGIYATASTLINKTQELFSKYLAKAKLNISPVTYVRSPASIVTTKWIEEKMKFKGIRIKQIAFDNGDR